MANDAYCVRAYQVIRNGVGGDAVRISEGRNLYPPSLAFLDHIARLTQHLLASDRFTNYESPADGRDRELVASLLGKYLDRPGIEARHVLFTNGSQEAISIVCAFGASQDLSAVLPLPTYYSYEQSSLRWGMPPSGYYRADGKLVWVGSPAGDLFHAMVLPNFVTGEVFALPDLDKRKTRLTLLDCIYQLGAFRGPGELSKTVRTALSEFSLDEVALLFTVSKDLSLPGLRASVLVSGNEELIKYAREDRFERVYSVNPILGQVIATYVALLLMNEARVSGDWDAQYRDLHYQFSNAGVPLPSSAAFLSMCDHFDAMTLHCEENLRQLSSGDCPLHHDLEPFAGYSVFPRLGWHFETSDEFLSWTNCAGRQHGLKLNPSYMFGGTPEVWEKLYPRESRIRVNLSYPKPALSVALQRLEAAMREATNV